MTDQYQQTNINRPMSFARRVDQNDIVVGPPIGVPLNADDEWLLALDDTGVPYTINLPNVQEVLGKDIVIKVDPGAGAGLPTIAALPGQTVEGAASFGPLAAGQSLTVRSDPPDLSTDPATQPTNWSIICLCDGPTGAN